MNKRSILFSFVLILSSCDPYQLVYVKNYTASELKLDVKFQKQAKDFDNYQIMSSDTIIENYKALLKYPFDKRIPVSLTSDSSYSVNLPPRSTSQLCPLTIGFPINQVVLDGKSGKDSILFFKTKADLKEQLKKGRLKKVNWAYFIYHYK